MIVVELVGGPKDGDVREIEPAADELLLDHYAGTGSGTTVTVARYRRTERTLTDRPPVRDVYEWVSPWR